jgi:hypothetical protein
VLGVSAVSLSWQWSAAVYTTFSANNNALGVASVDGGGFQLGAPTNFSNFVTGGARGGGGSNSTGSNSGAGSVSNITTLPADAGSTALEASSLVLLLLGLLLLGPMMLRRIRRRMLAVALGVA